MPTVADRPTWWPHFSSTLRSTALTARLGLALGIAFGVCFLTGLLSYYQYSPWSWLPTPTGPAWGYRLTQGVHVTTGIASIPLILVKLWSVYPNAVPLAAVPVRGADRRAAHAGPAGGGQPGPGAHRLLQRARLVSRSRGTSSSVHYALAYVVIGSVLLHVGIKLPDINYGLRAKLPAADVLTEIPWNENPDSHSNAGERPPPATPGISRRGVLAAAGAGRRHRRGRRRRTDADAAGAARSAGAPPAEPRTARAAGQQDGRGGPGGRAGDAADWRLEVTGPQPYALSLAEVEALPTVEVELPFAANEGWGADARWRGPRLLDLVQRAGGTASSRGPGVLPGAARALQQVAGRGRPAGAGGPGHPPQRRAAEPGPRVTRCGWSCRTGPDCSAPSGSPGSRCCREGRADRPGRRSASCWCCTGPAGSCSACRRPCWSCSGPGCSGALLVQHGVVSPLVVAVGAALRRRCPTAVGASCRPG